MDSLSLKTAERGGIRGFDAQKRVKGRKRHILVDTFGSSPHAEWSRLTSLIETPYSQPPRTGLRLFKHPLRTETGILGKRWQLSSSAIPAIYRAGRYAIRTSDYPLRVPETIVFPERLFMRLVKGSLAGLVMAGILAMMPAAAFAHGGGGGGGGGHGGGGVGHGFGGGGGGHGFGRGGGGHAFVGGGGHGFGGGHAFGGGGGGHAFVGGSGHGFGGDHAFGGFTGRGFSPGFSGTRGFSTGRFSGRGDHGHFGERGFHGRDRDFRDRRFRDFDGGFFDF